MAEIDNLNIVGGSPDVKTWSPTARITRLEFTQGDFLVTLDDIGNNWPEDIPPGWDGGVQFTLWVVINGYTTGCIEFWKGRAGVGGPFAKAAQDWYYFASEFQGHQPQEGEKVGFFVTQGDARRKDVHSKAERSEIVWVLIPGGPVVFDFTGPSPVPAPTPTPDPGPTPVPVPNGQLDRIEAKIDTLLTKKPVFRGKWLGYTIVLTSD